MDRCSSHGWPSSFRNPAGVSISAIARKLDLDRKTVRKYIARGLEPPAYGPRAPRPTKIDPYLWGRFFWHQDLLTVLLRTELEDILRILRR